MSFSLRNIIRRRPEVVISNFTDMVKAVTLRGRRHRADGSPCQDFHLYRELGSGWHLFIASDGAGSAAQSHRGARAACEVASHLLERLIDSREWLRSPSLPDDAEWRAEFISVSRTARQFIIDKIADSGLDVPYKDFCATLIAAIVTPYGILAGHIGDGRMAARAKDGDWNVLATPHRGVETNRTIFLLSDWDAPRVPSLRLGGALVPETIVWRNRPEEICIITDGCENFAWNCLQPRNGVWTDINTPFGPFWQHIAELSANSRPDAFVRFIDSGNKACEEEDDDRTLIYARF